MFHVSAILHLFFLRSPANIPWLVVTVVVLSVQAVAFAGPWADLPQNVFLKGLEGVTPALANANATSKIASVVIGFGMSTTVVNSQPKDVHLRAANCLATVPGAIMLDLAARVTGAGGSGFANQVTVPCKEFLAAVAAHAMINMSVNSPGFRAYYCQFPEAFTGFEYDRVSHDLNLRNRFEFTVRAERERHFLRGSFYSKGCSVPEQAYCSWGESQRVTITEQLKR
jgi:hypothetical protein